MMMRFLKGRVQIAGCLIRFVLLFRHATGYIPTSPKNTVALLGKTVILECTTNLSTPVRWKVNYDIIYYNEVITESLRSRFRIENSSYGTHNLVIDKVDLSHAGTYICLPTVYPGERDEGFSAQLTVLESEPVCDTNTSSLSTDGVEGDAIRLSCRISFDGCGRPVMDWHKSNGEAVDGSIVILNETTIIATSSLIIQLNSSDNDIIYSCHIFFSSNSTCPQMEEDMRAKNIPDFQHIWNYTTNVLYGPRNIIIYPTQTEYEIGDRITCSADGNPTPSYEWKDNGNGSREVIRGPILTVDETMISDHERIFRCTARNVVARKQKEISETVIVNVTGNRLQRAVQTYVVIALPIVCSLVLSALAVYLLIRFCKRSTSQKPEIVTRHEYETVLDTDFQNQGPPVELNESRGRQEALTEDSYEELTETEPVIYNQLHIYINQSGDT